MAKIRQNHTRSGKRPFSGLLVRVLLMFGIIAMLFVYAFEFLDSDDPSGGILIDSEDRTGQINLRPEGFAGETVDHGFFQLGYNERNEQADWVAYRLSKDELKIPNVPRAGRFELDPRISSGSSKHHDYSNSGYTRGHLAPAGDMAHSKESMEASFYMSNISPQISGFNGGIWRELEESTRDWAYQSGELWIAVGPVFDDVTKYIGKTSKVRVPAAFYKIIIDLNRKAGVGFLIEHEISDKHLSEYMQTIDYLEDRLQLDFFDNLYKDETEEKTIEGSINSDFWPISEKRYQTRLKNWNFN